MDQPVSRSLPLSLPAYRLQHQHLFEPCVSFVAPLTLSRGSLLAGEDLLFKPAVDPAETFVQPERVDKDQEDNSVFRREQATFGGLEHIVSRAPRHGESPGG